MINQRNDMKIYSIYSWVLYTFIGCKGTPLICPGLGIIWFYFQDCSYLKSCVIWYFHYEWAKPTKFLLSVIYGSFRQHSNSSKIFKKIGKNWNFYDHLGLAKSFKMMKRPWWTWPDPSVTLFNSLYIGKYER